MIVLTPDEKAAVRSIQLLFGKKYSEIKELFESVGIYAVLNYIKEKKIVLPYVGELDVIYEGDDVTDKGRVAKLKANFSLSPFLIRNISQIEDKEPTEAEKILVSRFRSVFKERIEKN